MPKLKDNYLLLSIPKKREMTKTGRKIEIKNRSCGVTSPPQMPGI